MSALQKPLLEAHDVSSERNRRRCYSGVCRNSRAARAGARIDFLRSHSRLRMSARTDRPPVSCVDPGWQDYRPDAHAVPDAALAIFISRVACCLGGVLATLAPARMARSAVFAKARATPPDSARRP